MKYYRVGFDEVLYGMSYANFVLYSSVIPDYSTSEKRSSKPKRSGMTFSELLGAMKGLQ